MNARGELHLHTPEGALPLEPDIAARLRAAFSRGTGEGLLEVGGALVGRPLPPAWAWFRALGERFLAAVCRDAEGEGEEPPTSVPPIDGADHLDTHLLWNELARAFSERVRETGSTEAALQSLSPAWHKVGRVVLNLAENRRDELFPFAFMATYTTRLSARGAPQHTPLRQALSELAGRQRKSALIALLEPLSTAAGMCPWLGELVASGEIYSPLRWTPAEAAQLLADVPRLESAGLTVRMPAQWGGLPPRPRVTVTVGSRPTSGLGQSALIDFQVQVTLEGEVLTESEVAALLARGSELALLRGRWVELDAERLASAREKLESLAQKGGALPLSEAARLSLELDPEHTRVIEGEWLSATLAGLRDPARLAALKVPALEGTLRPYQDLGVRWLDGLTRLGLGALLADDMGLGKTVQVLSLLLAQRAGKPSLLIAPATLLANWVAEAERFAPTLRLEVLHGSAPRSARPDDEVSLEAVDLVVTTYGTVARDPAPAWLDRPWHLIILDEAQAIKNAGTKQARAVKRIAAHARVALTGTPIENRLGDLWSLFDFLNPGLLGSAKSFTAWTKSVGGPDPWRPLRELVAPYILRRKKSDRAILPDLPAKVEIDAHCGLSRLQVALYQEAVAELEDNLKAERGMKRRGLVLAMLQRMKQICNHPSQWLGDGRWDEADSAKLQRLRVLAETIAARQEKVLVFTQYREIVEQLATFLGDIFGRSGLTLSGETKLAERKARVDRFQRDDDLPFFVLSLKAGGTGLTLTAASHVIHFDRWWNPAVEDQASDRAYRIGQTSNVMVHRLICRGTVEDKVADLIASKRSLSSELIDVKDPSSELNLTELPDDEILRLVRLDLRAIHTLT